MSKGTDLAKPVKTGVQVLAEYLLPGGSNLANGNIEQAGIHAVLGLAARAVLGVPGLLLVSANSLSKAMTGQHLYEYAGLLTGDSSAPAAPTNADKVKPASTK